VICQVLEGVGSHCLVIKSAAELIDVLNAGAGAVFVTEEALAGADLDPFKTWLASQPPWSDIPVVVLVTNQPGRRSSEASHRLEVLGNVLLIERPVNPETLITAAQSALRARSRQYEARRFSDTLETRIAERTVELRETNQRLISEIAERERAQAALVQAQKMEAVGQLTGGIAHDFNNLLTAIVGNVDMIARRTTDERIERMAGYAREAVDRATKLTGQLLAFSRSQQLDLHPVEIDRLIVGMDDLLDRSLGHTIEVRTELAAPGASAIADANQLELAILNLAINSRDAMPDGGVLTIATRIAEDWGEELKPGRYLVVSVSDTGSGIPENLLPRVFDPFFTTKSLGKGTGLGLSQVYGIASQSGGVARAHNRRGAGATIEIWLPLADVGEVRLGDDAPADATRLGRGEKVLVIDDDPDVRRFIVQCLEVLQYHVTQAEQGSVGLERLAHDRPDLLIVDFAMPGMNGAEVAARARAQQRDLPIILVTGYADTEAIESVVTGESVLRKPFKVDELARAVHAALAPLCAA
jgi:signal transduction histidine kinase